MEESQVPYISLQNIITKSSLFDIHNNQISKQMNNTHHMKELVNTLGGIDKILSDYLSTQNQLELTQIQLNQIHKIITSNPSDICNEHQIFAMAYTFQIDNTFIYRLFNREMALKITNLVYNNITIALVLCTTFTSYLWDATNSDRMVYQIYHLISNIFNFIVYFFFIVTLNISAFKLSSKSFLFWFKLLLTFKYFIANVLLITYVEFWGDIKSSNVAVGAAILGNINISLLMIAICAIDGIYVSRRKKIVCMLALCILFSILAIRITFDFPKIDRSVISITSNISFSIYDQYISSIRVLSIFFWRQTISLIRRPNQCINITTTPYIKWK